jgi:hypothetical protein
LRTAGKAYRPARCAREIAGPAAGCRRVPSGRGDLRPVDVDVIEPVDVDVGVAAPPSRACPAP